VSRVVVTPPMIEMLEALFGDTIAIDENNGVVELDLRKDGAFIVNGSRLYPDGSWGSAGEPEDEPRVPLSEVKEALTGHKAAEALALELAAETGARSIKDGAGTYDAVKLARARRLLAAVRDAAFSSTDSEGQS
jgi:hypothetical protein